MTDTSGDGIPDALAEELGLDPHHEHHPLFSETLVLIEERDPEFVSTFVELTTVEDPDPVAVPFSVRSMIEQYLAVASRDPEIIPALNEQILSTESVEFIERQLHVLSSTQESFVAELAAERALGDSDWDNDGLKNWEELEYGTSYSDPETSGDGLYDGEAVAIGVSPTKQHEHLGELATQLRKDEPLSGNELEFLRLIADDPNGIAEQLLEHGFHENGEITDEELTAAADPDRDGLITAIEKEVGTDPQSADSSGDGLIDSWKYFQETPGGRPLPNAEPTQMDLYILVLYTDEATPLSTQEKETIKQWWADFGVENLDGTSGINLHITEGPNNGKVDGEPESKDVVGYRDAFYNKEYMEDKHGTHYLAIFGEIEDDRDPDGMAVAGGQTSVVIPGLPSRSRLQVLSHELLHNVVGELDENVVSERQIQCGNDPKPDPYHTCSGLLAANARGTSVVSDVEKQLTEVGFAADISSGVVSSNNADRGVESTQHRRTTDEAVNHIERKAPQVVSCDCLDYNSNDSLEKVDSTND